MTMTPLRQPWKRNSYEGAKPRAHRVADRTAQRAGEAHGVIVADGELGIAAEQGILGLEAQMMGGMMDGIAQVLSYSLHLKDGYFLEGSWDDAFYTRQWNTPPDVQVVVMPPTSARLTIAPTGPSGARNSLR